MLDGLQSSLNEFWNSWNELSKAPDSLTIRALVKQRGESLVYHLNHMGSQINKLQDDINTEIIKRIDEVNSITTKIAKLNDLVIKAQTAAIRPTTIMISATIWWISFLLWLRPKYVST